MGLIVAMGLTVMACMALWAPQAQAQALFGTTSPPVAGDSVFYRIDPTTGAATPIGPVNFSRVSGIAFHPTTGVLYAVGFDGLTHVLLTIDKATASTLARSGPATLGRSDPAEERAPENGSGTGSGTARSSTVRARTRAHVRGRGEETLGREDDGNAGWERAARAASGDQPWGSRREGPSILIVVH
jgi:hypothetical protein